MTAAIPATPVPLPNQRDDSGGDSPDESDPPAPPMGVVRIALLSLYLLFLAGASVYLLFRIWPLDPASVATEATAQAATPGAERAQRATGDTVSVFGLILDFRPPRSDRRLLLISLLAGGLGAFVSSAFSMARFLGKQKLTRPWTLYYILRPPSGMILALVVYFLLRGGLLQPGAGTDAVSPYGVAAFSGLIGMFVREATDKLRHVAESLFSAPVPKDEASPTEPETGATAPVPPLTPGAVAAAHHPDPGA